MEKTPKEKAIDYITKMEDEYYEKSVFCREHNFHLEKSFNEKMETDLRRIRRKLESIL